MKYLTFTLLFIFLVVSCTTSPAASNTSIPDTAVTSPPEGTMPANQLPVNPFAPKPGDENLIRGDVFIHESSLVIRESFPPQISLLFNGDLSTPCHELRAIPIPPDAENKIVIEAYSVVNPDVICAQVLQSFEASMDLGTYPSGHYTVWINGEMAGEFDT